MRVVKTRTRPRLLSLSRSSRSLGHGAQWIFWSSYPAACETLAIRGEEFWPPVYEEGGVQIGAYLVQYDNTDTKPSRDDLLFNPGGAAEIMPLSREAIAKRIARR